MSPSLRISDLMSTSTLELAEILDAIAESIVVLTPPRLCGVIRMQEHKMGVPRGPGVDPQAQRMVRRETEVLPAARIDECQPTGGIRVPGVGGDLVERGLQLRLERADRRWRMCHA